MLVPLALSPEQLTIAVIVLTLYFPCAATFCGPVQGIACPGYGQGKRGHDLDGVDCGWYTQFDFDKNIRGNFKSSYKEAQN